VNLNTNYYKGRFPVTNDMYRCRTFKSLANNYGVVFPNQPIDESCFPFGTTNDSLTVPLFIRAENVADGGFKLTQRYYKPRVNNYLPVRTFYSGSGDAGEWTEYVTQERIGMDATLENIIDVAPIIEMQTKYFVLLIMVRYRDVISKTTDSAGTTVYEVGNEHDVGYDYFIENVAAGFDNEFIIVTGVYAVPYYGTNAQRIDVSYDNVDILSSMGNASFGVPDDIIDDYTITEYTDRKALYSRRFCSSLSLSLIQGGGSTRDVTVGSNVIFTITRANPLFWKIARAKTTGATCSILAYIDNVTDLTLAYKAYRATGFYFFGNAVDAGTYNIDNPDPDNPPERGATSDSGRVNGAEGSSEPTGLQTDPTKMHDTGYNGNINIDPNIYVDSTPLTKPQLSTLGAFNRTFAVNYSAIQTLANWLWNADESVFDEIIKGLGLMGEIPINGIIDVRMYPFDVASILTTAGEQAIKIGRTTSPANGLIASTTDNAIIDMGYCNFNRDFDSFLDYSPYTEARLYIPYCGVIPIDTAEFMGHELSAKMIVDIVTGACTVLIYKDQIITYYAQGVCGVSIPFTGTDSAGYAQGVLNSVVNGAISVATGAFTGNAADVVKGAGDLFSGFATPVQYATGGTSTPNCGTWQPQYAYLIIDHPEPIAPDDYGHCVGYACEIYNNLSAFSGFTVISNPDLTGFAATETEKEMIKSLMQEGIYL
jgi:hypothetical protein